MAKKVVYLRVDEELWQACKLKAYARGDSLNAWVARVLEKQVEQPTTPLQRAKAQIAPAGGSLHRNHQVEPRPK